MDIIILTQNQDVIAVFKPHNMFSVGGPGAVRPTLLDLVRKKFGKNIYPVHRLDRVTAGITVFARSIFAKHALDNAFNKRLVKKNYYALCEGHANFQKLTVNKALKKIDLNKANPISGRMHQIRCHLASINLPIVGDKLYGAKTILAPHTIALCAIGLSIPLPKGGRMDIDASHLFDIKSYLPS
jgi:tRNA pseudouridine65 synthase